MIRMLEVIEALTPTCMLKHDTTVVPTMLSVVLQCICSDGSHRISHPQITGKCCHC